MENRKLRVLFVCLGNICRSPMAEFIMKDMVEKAGLSDRIYVESAATSYEEQGNPVHSGTVKVLSQMGISCSGKRARRMNAGDYEAYDYLIGMDRTNVAWMQTFISKNDPEREKLKSRTYRLLDFTNRPRDIADPWFTGNFDDTRSDVIEGCEALLKHLREKL